MTKNVLIRAAVGAGVGALLFAAAAVGPTIGTAEPTRETGTVKWQADGREIGTVKLADGDYGPDKAAGDKKVEVIKG